MKITSFSSYALLAFSLAMAGFVQAVSADQVKRPAVVESPGGYRAEFVKLPGEGKGKTVVSKEGKKIAEIPNARPLSFSPTEDVLLVAEYAPSDDNRQYLLNIGKGEYAKEGKRTDYVFGGRYRKVATWSPDGKEITLHYSEISATKEETFAVDKLLSR